MLSVVLTGSLQFAVKQVVDEVVVKKNIVTSSRCKNCNV